jgi:hypothetical protein
MVELKAPVDKLPLAVRKELRDEYTAKIPELQAKITELLGEEWKLDINPSLIYAYAEPDSYASGSLGSCLYS